jgi:hypothetical protein
MVYNTLEDNKELIMDPDKVHVVNAYTGKVYGSFVLDIDARQYMRNMLLKECPAPDEDSGEIPKLWCYDARGAESNTF